MTERLINIQVHWSGTPDDHGVEQAPWTFTGVTPSTRNDDGSDPPTLFIPKAFMNPQVVAAFEQSAFPALIAARAARIAALEPPEQRAARLAEEAAATKAQLDKQIEAKQAEDADLDARIVAKRAELEALTAQAEEPQEMPT